MMSESGGALNLMFLWLMVGGVSRGTKDVGGKVSPIFWADPLIPNVNHTGFS